MKDFDAFTKISYKYWPFGHNNYYHSLWKVAQSAINRPIWSHWDGSMTLIHWFIPWFKWWTYTQNIFATRQLSRKAYKPKILFFCFRVVWSNFTNLSLTTLRYYQHYSTTSTTLLPALLYYQHYANISTTPLPARLHYQHDSTTSTTLLPVLRYYQDYVTTSTMPHGYYQHYASTSTALL